jgi:site-specific DNA recombinase
LPAYNYQKTITMETAIAYIRVSTSDQEGSLEVQEKQIREYARFKGITISKFIIDEDVSGFTELYKRKGGSEIKAELNSANAIIAIKPDRLFRNLKDALITVDEWNSNDIALHIVDMGGSSFTTKTAIGRLMFSTIISFAEFERNITGERTKVVLKNKKDTNKIYSRPMLGFDNVDGNLVPNESEQKIIKTIKDLSVNYRPTGIANILNDAGYRTKNGKMFLQSTVNYIIKNEIYK